MTNEKTCIRREFSVYIFSWKFIYYLRRKNGLDGVFGGVVARKTGKIDESAGLDPDADRLDSAPPRAPPGHRSELA